VRYELNAPPSSKKQIIQYKTVSTRTLKGLREAEALKRAGWTIYSVGLFIIGFYKKGAR
jgi:hypothetical protein